MIDPLVSVVSGDPVNLSRVGHDILCLVVNLLLLVPVRVLLSSFVSLNFLIQELLLYDVKIVFLGSNFLRVGAHGVHRDVSSLHVRL